MRLQIFYCFEQHLLMADFATLHQHMYQMCLNNFSLNFENNVLFFKFQNKTNIYCCDSFVIIFLNNILTHDVVWWIKNW